MASDKSVNSNHTLSTNVKIKVEPGTSMPVSIKNIKTEPGLSTTTTTRLTSFRLPRDLTLGGNIKTEKPKKVYTPNLNAQRTKKKDDGVQNDSTKSVKGQEHNRGRGRGDRGKRTDRGRGRGSNLIQSSGIWSSGASNTQIIKRGSGGGGTRDSERSTQSALERPKLELNRNINKAEEEEKLKQLLRDDFIDDGEPLDYENGPIMLPMFKEAKVHKEEVKEKIEEEQDRKPTILENGEVKVAKSGVELKEEFDSIPQMIENKTNSYILIQFPDCLPGFVSNEEDTRPTRSNVSNHDKENGHNSETNMCTLNSLKPGILGKLQILKSGKTRLLLGENNLIVDVGSHLSFRQDLLAAKVDTEQLNGDLINLGPVSNTLICSPDWESMLAKL
ncbi:DNA-directed RNA polymerase III subunit RPC4 isoform X2 [Colletes gigas]|uniref:DNA-directed RNA polymerase III subunit RPC4 isoform X2 n=1 Tax=Colletes gigas TaxID=935657 RepID=UPI001C9A9501|nr:DNA-directed RNA polymerase III subunit RPC4 isoform X2 [Colletes gigas]